MQIEAESYCRGLGRFREASGPQAAHRGGRQGKDLRSQAELQLPRGDERKVQEGAELS